jgi:hypothetical protein
MLGKWKWDNAKWDHLWFKSGLPFCQLIINNTLVVITVSIVIVIITIVCIHHPSSTLIVALRP